MLFLLLPLFLGSCTTPPSPPNVLIILADDLGWNQLAHNGGPYDTPRLDRLATEGIKFTQAYASAAVCSPTRAALMTGKYPARLHLTDFIKGQEFPDSLLQQPKWQKHLPLEERTMGEVFLDAGYRTAYFGKWHLSREKMPPLSDMYNPDKQGFEEYIITYKPGRDSDPEADAHNMDSITRAGIDYLESVGKDPFLMVLAHNAIHDPLMEQEARIQAYKEKEWDSDLKVDPRLGAMVHRLDENCGKILDKLEELGLSQNTIVVFASDNGGKESYASQAPYRSGKGWLYEGGLRVPLLIRWPGVIQHGSDYTYPNATMDLLPTLAALAGISMEGMQTDGISLDEAILDRKELPGRSLYWHYPHYHRGSGMKPASAIRKGKYKLLEWHEELLLDTHAWELYDLEEDPSETMDLSSKEPQVLDSLRRDLHSWRRVMDAQMPELN
jgi:arylsulfatase A-like enzyme